MRTLEFGHGLVESPFILKGLSLPVMRRGIIRVQLDRPLKLRHRRSELQIQDEARWPGMCVPPPGSRRVPPLCGRQPALFEHHPLAEWRRSKAEPHERPRDRNTQAHRPDPFRSLVQNNRSLSSGFPSSACSRSTALFIVEAGGLPGCPSAALPAHVPPHRSAWPATVPRLPWQSRFPPQKHRSICDRRFRPTDGCRLRHELYCTLTRT